MLLKSTEEVLVKGNRLINWAILELRTSIPEKTPLGGGVKMQSTEWVKIYAINTSNKGLVCQNIKNQYKSIRKRSQQYSREWVKN